MKKRLLIILTLLLCVSLAACNLVPPTHSGSSDNSGSTESTDSSDPNLSEKIYFPLEKDPPTTDKKYIPSNPSYTIRIRAGGHFIKPSYEYGSYPVIQNISDSTKYTIRLGKREFEAYHSGIGLGTHIFVSEDNSITYIIVESTMGDCFTLSNIFGSLIQYENNDFSEKALLDFAKDYMSSFVDIGNIDDYTYGCITKVSVDKPHMHEYRDGFYISEDLTEGEKILHYEFRFEKYCHGYKTADNIIVKCWDNGDIYSFSYQNNKINWNDYAVFTQPEQLNKIENQIADYLPNAISDEWTLKSLEHGEPWLIYEDGEAKLTVTYYMDVGSVSENSSGATGLCQIVVGIN